MKDKLALVIAALMITSMALSISTTTVSASATLEPTSTRADTRIKLTVVVTNETSDNIDNVRIMAPSGSGFTQAIGGVRTAENLKLAADNLENAVAPLKQAGENLKLAADNKESDAGPAVSSAGTSLQTAAIRAAILVMENEVATSIEDAGLALEEAGDAMELASENFTLIVSKLNEVATTLHSAAGNAEAGENMMAYNVPAAENLDNAAERIGDAAAALEGGSLRRAGENLKIAGDNLENAGTALGGAAGSDFTSAGTSLRDAGQALIDAAQYDNLAGINLGTAAAYLQSAGAYIGLADPDLTAAGDNLENAASDGTGSIAAAGDNLTPATDNVLAAGDALSSAATYLATAATELGAALGGDELEDAMEHENAAAENLNVDDVNLGTAGQQLIDAADDLSAAATSLLATANALAPATWNLSDGTDFVQFNAIGDNVIVPGDSETFVFLWTTPTIATDKTYTIAISSNKEGGGAAHWIIQDTRTLTVDGAFPTLTIVVTQAGVVDKDGDAVNNVVGTALDDAKATITITASETLQSIGTVTVENAGTFLTIPSENLTTTDNKVYTYQFTVGEWDDNSPVKVKVASAKDLAGIENTAGMENSFTVDTRAPIFVPSENSGLSTLVLNMGSKTQAGTDTTFAYVDNKTTQSIIIRVEDNIDSTDNDVWVISVTVDTTSATRSAVVENLWSMDPLTLSEGLTSVLTVTATDRTGNTVSENVENIFIDTAAPTIAFNTIAGKTWTSGIRINDNTPEIKVTVNDPGYSVSGLGIASENLVVRVDNDDNFLNGSPYTWGTLENKGVWDFGLAGVFENIIENAGAGLLEGTYWVTVAASDNLAHDGEENQYDALSFIIDVTAPTVPLPTTALDNPLIATTISSPYVQKSTTFILSGTSVDPGDTLSVYLNDATTAATTATVDSAGRWTVNISLTAGATTKVEVTLTDVAGNEGARRLYGYVMADGTAPTVTLTTLPETTDKSSITISGTVSIDPWEDLSDITLTVQVGTGRVVVPIGAGGSYSYSLALSEGPNTIVVQASDVIGNASVAATSTVERVVTPWSIYAIILVIVALILAAIAIFGGPRIWKR